MGGMAAFSKDDDRTLQQSPRPALRRIGLSRPGERHDRPACDDRDARGGWRRWRRSTPWTALTASLSVPTIRSLPWARRQRPTWTRRGDPALPASREDSRQACRHFLRLRCGRRPAHCRWLRFPGAEQRREPAQAGSGRRSRRRARGLARLKRPRRRQPRRNDPLPGNQPFNALQDLKRGRDHSAGSCPARPNHFHKNRPLRGFEAAVPRAFSDGTRESLTGNFGVKIKRQY